MKQKHPHGKDAYPEVLLPDIPEGRNSTYQIPFDRCRECKESNTKETKVTARPSGLDVDDWKRILTLNQSGNSSNDLCKTFAEVIKNFVRHIYLSSSLEALVVCRLMPLDRNPGLRPIRIGEVLSGIASEVVVSHIREDII